MLTLKEIWERFPNPVKSKDGMSDRSYCVGGAFMLSTGGLTNKRYYRFPSPGALYEAFCTEGCSENKASIFSYNLILANESGDFNKAWEILGEALENMRTRT